MLNLILVEAIIHGNVGYKVQTKNNCKQHSLFCFIHYTNMQSGYQRRVYGGRGIEVCNSVNSYLKKVGGGGTCLIFVRTILPPCKTHNGKVDGVLKELPAPPP